VLCLRELGCMQWSGVGRAGRGWGGEVGELRGGDSEKVDRAHSNYEHRAVGGHSVPVSFLLGVSFRA
jgi:hypothetical protein